MRTNTPLDEQLKLSLGTRVIELCSIPGHPLARTLVDSLVTSTLEEGRAVVWCTANRKVDKERWLEQMGEKQRAQEVTGDERTKPRLGSLFVVHTPTMAMLLVALRQNIPRVLVEERAKEISARHNAGIKNNLSNRHGSLVVIDEIATLLQLSTGPYSSTATVATGRGASAKMSIVALYRTIGELIYCTHTNVVMLDSFATKFVDIAEITFEAERRRKEEWMDLELKVPPPAATQSSARMPPPKNTPSKKGEELRGLRELVPFMKLQGPDRQLCHARIQVIYKNGKSHIDMQHRQDRRKKKRSNMAKQV
ncbi:YALIA101S05e08108g1_1 [Yarrowia lipolytica]|nr:Hypothetical protein YALI2_E01605g [Yarrowia lipolytica]SEI34679.1 YALIA101S05e08108g1_1 [Yarrowia lipolytica]VBB78989.1 Hypothetical protein conserved in the Yarrowia clade [Yarrowia lipolytica]